jgi:alpha-L-rhamnosidase
VASTHSTIRVSSLRAEYRGDTGFIATATPRLSWKTETAIEGWLQSVAELRAGEETALIESRESVLVDWPFAPLGSGETREVSVRVTGTDGSTSDWSEPLELTGGFLADGAWAARMIGLESPERDAQPALLRTEFTVSGPVARATLHATAHGVYQVEVNGTEVDDQILKPGWTSYQFRLTHETTDVTALLTEGSNAIGVTLAGGWFTESFGFRESAAPVYGSDPAVALQLEITYADGSTQTVLSDDGWVATGDGPITASSIYDGENFDATRAIDGWSAVGFDASAWTRVRVDGEYPTPTPRSAPAVRAIEEIGVKEVITSPSGRAILDFGQNLVGRLRVTVRGERGHTITLRHAEVLENGELGIRPLRRAKATDHYTLAGTGDETWEPRFTFHGFRYAEIENLPGDLDPADVTAVVIHSDMERTGWFDSSHELVNKLHENVVWGMRGNFLYLPTDCPQRDERLGWTGDIQVFAPTASYLYEADGFLAGWLEDLALEQKAKGGIVPFIVPDVLGDESATTAAAAWGDAATVVPWVLYERFGNLGVLADQYESMKSWADSLIGIAGERYLWEGKFQFGDWLDPDAPAAFPADAKTDPDIVASAYLFRSVEIVSRAATVLGNDRDAETYAAIAATVRRAFLREYVSESGRMMSDAQTGYGLAIMFGLTRSEDERQRMGDRLAFLVRSAGYRIGTGFVGTPLVAEALAATGHLEVAGRLLTQTENPSWLYPVTMGATTIWERWDSMLEDGSINPGEMTSFNHYALGAIADWMHRSLAGLAPASPGYRDILVAPRPLAEFDFARTSHETPYGLASTGWTRTAHGTIEIEAVIPPNTTAEVWLPGSSEFVLVGSGSHSWSVPAEAEAPAPGEVSLSSALSEIIDDPAAYAAVGSTIAAYDDDAARIFRRHTQWTPGRTLGEVMHQLPPLVRDNVASALKALSEQRR